MRIGQGIDVHAFDPDLGRPLRLGGVVVPEAPALAGHSDADVVLHALVDALLGAVAAGDLGGLVGVDDPAVAGADSAGFVRRALGVAADRGHAVVNVDLTIVAQRPRLAPHVDAMRDRVAGLLEVGRDDVSVKATTTDRLGTVGRGEGIACWAVALLAPRGVS